MVKLNIDLANRMNVHRSILLTDRNKIRPAGIRQLAGPAILVAVFAAMAAVSWRKWAHVLVDFGRELYVPWQMSQGAALYQDLAYFNGPFSPSFNAALFRVFGASMTTLAVANLVLLALLVGLLYRWLAREFGRTAATLSCLMFVSAFAFAQYGLAGNYNYVHPYSHEMTHGILLSVMMLTFLGGKPAVGWPQLVAAGICWGLLFLGKAEIFLAASAAAPIALAATLAARPGSRRRCLAHAAIFALSGILPVISFCLSLTATMDIGDALWHLCGSWRWVFDSEVTDQHFYRLCTGLNAPLANLWKTLQAVALFLLAMVGLVVFDRWYAGGSRSAWPLLLVIAVLVTVSLLQTRHCGFLIQGRALLFLTPCLCGLFAWSLWKHRGSIRYRAYLLPKLAWSVFALLLLAKMLLVSRIQHYGFALGMPATLLLIACLVAYLPRRICRWPRGGRAFRVAVIVLLTMDAMKFANLSRLQFGQKRLPIAHRGERFYTEDASVISTGPIVNQVLDEIETCMPADATFVAFPEGVMLNYLSRRRTSSRFTNFMPVEMAMYGEQAILSGIQKRPPDYVLLIDKDMAEYGVGPFGSSDYGPNIMAWIEQHYRTKRVFGSEPFRGEGFGVKLLTRRAPDT